MIKSNFLDVPENALILGADHYYSMDGKQTHVNNNVLCVGRSGSGKSRYIVSPNLLQINGSYVVSDPKGQLYRQFRSYFEEHGYKVSHINFRKPGESVGYNPLYNAKSTSDYLKVAHSIIHTDGHGRTPDPYWDNAAFLLLSSIIGYVIENDGIPKEEKNLNKVQELLPLCNFERIKVSETKYYSNRMSQIMEGHNKKMLSKGKKSWAAEQFKKIGELTPERTLQTILSVIYSYLSQYNSVEVQKLLSKNDIDFKSIGQRKTILFVEVSDTDRSLDSLASLFFTQLLNELCSYADECPDGHLPIPVQLIMDDFGSVVQLNNDFPSIISNIRSRWISTMLFLQDINSLEAQYGVEAETIISNCSSCLYLGSGFGTASKFAKWANKGVHEFLNLNLNSAWLFRTGQKPEIIDFIDVEKFMIQKGFDFPNKEEYSKEDI